MAEQVTAALAKSWRTTAAGVLAGVAILAHELAAVLDADPSTTFSLEAVILALGLMGVGAAARDNGVTSEQAGAKKEAA